jgi:NitT/TauT family transport system ATP-binding protein
VVADSPEPEPQGGARRDAFVELEKVTHTYGRGERQVHALTETSLRIEKGDFVALVGPSGCGKSTILKLVTGLINASSGYVFVAGRQVGAEPVRVGMAFQNPTLLPWRSILDNVMLPFEVVEPHPARLRKHRAEYEDKCRDLLRLVGLDGFEKKNPWHLSGGMQQRASLCRALVHDPELLMLDEPFAALDIFTREDLWGVLQNLWLARRPTVILVTHDLREAVFLADRVLVMTSRPGRIMVERKIDLPRPRVRDMTYTPYFQDMVHDLREHIDRARQEENVAEDVAHAV